MPGFAAEHECSSLWQASKDLCSTTAGPANIMWANLSKKLFSPKELEKKKVSYTLPNSKLNTDHRANSFICNGRHIRARPATIHFCPGTAWHSLGAQGQGGRSPAASVSNPQRPPPAAPHPGHTQTSLQDTNPHPVATACIPSESSNTRSEAINWPLSSFYVSFHTLMKECFSHVSFLFFLFCSIAVLNHQVRIYSHFPQ